MDGTCPQCRVQVEEGKVNGGINGSGRQWIHDRKMKGGLKHLDIWMYPLIFIFFYFIFRKFLLFCHRCWWGSEWRKNTYEKVWIKGVEWVGERHG